MEYTLEVYGRIWQGHRATYRYPLPAPPANDEEALRAAGDFAELIDWNLFTSTVNVQEDRKGDTTTITRTTVITTLRPWRNKRNARRMRD